MKLTVTQRWMVLGGLLAATVTAGMLAEGEPVPRKAPRKSATTGTAATAGWGDRQGRAATRVSLQEPALPGKPPEEVKIDPFRSKSWYVAPPPPPRPKPQAPPLPFQYLGKVIEDGEIRVFLARQGKHLVVRAGDVVDDSYFVAEISGNRIVFVYQPLNEYQTLGLGG